MDSFPQYRAISGLSILIKTHSRRIKHYQSAAVGTDNNSLSLLFRRYASHSQESVQKLLKWLIDSGGPANYPIYSRQASLWERISRIFKPIKVDELLHKSEAIERYALKVHRDAITLSVLPPAAAPDIREEIRKCEEAFATIKRLKQQGVEQIMVAW